MDDSQARFAAMLAGFMSDVKPTPSAESSSEASPAPAPVAAVKPASPPKKPAYAAPTTRDASESVAELTLNDDVDENPEDHVIDPEDDMYRASVTQKSSNHSNDRESNAELPAALRKAQANAKPSISESGSESSYQPTPPQRSASPPPKPVSSHPPLSASSSPAPTSSSPSSAPHTDGASDVGAAVPAGPVYKTIMVNGPNGEKREMKIIAINPGKPLLTSEGISSKPTGGGYGGAKGWVDDDETTKCMRCPNEFSLANRRHHCRACGFVVCGTCSNHTEVLNGSDERHRVCFHCFFEIAKTGKRPYPIDRPEESGGGLGDMFAFSKKEH